MSFEKSDAAIRGMSRGSSEHLTAEATVNALKAVDATINHASGTLREMTSYVNENLSSLHRSSDRAAGAATQLVEQLDSLNRNLARFDSQATRLGKTANTLTIGLLVAAFIQAAATVAQIFWPGN